MLRNIFPVLLVIALPGWLQQVSAPPTEAARRDDVYSIYSTLLANTSGFSDPIMMIASNTISGESRDPQECINLPPEYQSRMNELLMEYSQSKNIQETIEPAFKISRGYLVLTSDETAEFTSNWDRIVQKPPNPKFQGAKQLYFLGKVYFSLDRTLAMTSISMGCGSLCGTSGWRVFEKNRDGNWVLVTRRVGTVACGDSRA